ncbi:MAG: hypothetical protein KJ077_08005 [Anaerolineae bacterium]|nr:hypothetical protein [Anaerolineae bacterium]
MEHKHKGVTFAVERAVLGVQVVVREAGPGRIDFSQADTEAVVRHFNTHPMPEELAFPTGRAAYAANLVVVTEAMVRNAIKAAGL